MKLLGWNSGKLMSGTLKLAKPLSFTDFGSVNNKDHPLAKALPGIRARKAGCSGCGKENGDWASLMLLASLCIPHWTSFICT